MDEEMKAIEKNCTWELTTLPKREKVIRVKWVYKVKKNVKDTVKRYKDRLISKGYKQKAGIDYNEVFVLVISMETIHLILSITAQYKWPIFQIDVKLIFLKGYIDKDVYIE